MPLIASSNYAPSRWFRHPHFNTIYAALGRQVDGVRYHRQRLPTADGDFLDLDWSIAGADRLLIALHGLEGSADRPYMRGIVRHFNGHGWDALALNFRGCSGEPNRSLRSYHMGETSDLEEVLLHVRNLDRYRVVVMTGFSLGGNILLKFLGEQGKSARRLADAAIAFSVPCHIPSANAEIGRWYNYLYLRRFLRSLNAKIEVKARQFPGQVDLRRPLPRTFRGFDDRFTAPIHGFRDAAHYWEACSSLIFIPGIRLPVLLVNAADDTFLSRACYPEEEARRSPHFFLETPRWGGHVGFAGDEAGGAFWSERRALAFAVEKTGGGH